MARLDDLLPQIPKVGPPFPTGLNAKWPWTKNPSNPIANPAVTPDAEIEEMTQRKRDEFKAKGYPPGQIERALLWAKEWSFGSTKATFDVSPEIGRQVFRRVYKQALTLSDKWIESLLQS